MPRNVSASWEGEAANLPGTSALALIAAGFASTIALGSSDTGLGWTVKVISALLTTGPLDRSRPDTPSPSGAPPTPDAWPRSGSRSIVATVSQPRISMDGRGAWRDNVFVERLWRSIKYEEIYLRAYDSVSEARASIGRYLTLYNGRRPHSSFDRKTPDQAYFDKLPQIAAA